MSVRKFFLCVVIGTGVCSLLSTFGEQRVTDTTGESTNGEPVRRLAALIRDGCILFRFDKVYDIKTFAESSEVEWYSGGEGESG